MTERNIGEVLRRTLLVDEAQIAKAVELKERSGKQIGQCLVELGFITETELEVALGLQAKLRGSVHDRANAATEMLSQAFDRLAAHAR